MSLLDIWNWLKDIWLVLNNSVSDFWDWLINADLLSGLFVVTLLVGIVLVSTVLRKIWRAYDGKLERLYLGRPKLMYGLYLFVFGLLLLFSLVFLVGLLLGFSFVVNIFTFLVFLFSFLILALLTKPKREST
jgi:amino acid permease